MDTTIDSLIHENEDIPLCPRMTAFVRSDPKGYRCDIPSDLRKRFLGDTPCSVCKGCIPREQDPDAVQEALLDEYRRKYHLRAPRGAK